MTVEVVVLQLMLGQDFNYVLTPWRLNYGELELTSVNGTHLYSWNTRSW